MQSDNQMRFSDLEKGVVKETTKPKLRKKKTSWNRQPQDLGRISEKI